MFRAGLVMAFGVFLCVLIATDKGDRSSVIGLGSIMLSVIGLGSLVAYVFKFSIRMFLFN